VRSTAPASRAFAKAASNGYDGIEVRPSHRKDCVLADRKTVEAVAEDCPCLVTNCPIHGHCVECVRGHRHAANHIPECMQDQLRDLVAALARKLEYEVKDVRPKPAGAAKAAPEGKR
jgi:sugar phosphate isomerase/epimerase